MHFVENLIRLADSNQCTRWKEQHSGCLDHDLCPVEEGLAEAPKSQVQSKIAVNCLADRLDTVHLNSLHRDVVPSFSKLRPRLHQHLPNAASQERALDELVSV